MARRWTVSLGAAAVACVLAGCSTTGPQVVPLPEMSSEAPAGDAPSSSPAPSATSAPTDELSGGEARHVVRSGGLTIDVGYSVSTPARWASDGGTPVQVVVSVRERGRKIYLTRATMRFVLDDGSASLAGPEPLVDTANLTPGYLVTTPYSYVQSFSVPPVDRSARTMRMNVKLELVSLVDKKAKDYSKQTVTDVVTTTVSA